MLEDLVDNEKSAPADVALAILSFLQTQLPAGGSTLEKRFIRLYGPLCERIFGKVLDAHEGYRHKGGAWFSTQNPWKVTSLTMGPAVTSPPQPTGRPGLSSLTTQPIPTDPVLTLLGAAGNPNIKVGGKPPHSLIEAISKESENRPALSYKFPFHGLPKPTQTAWLQLLEVLMGGANPHRLTCTSNEKRLLGQLLRKNPIEQIELIRYRNSIKSKQQQPSNLPLSPRQFSVPLSPHQQSPINQQQQTSVAEVIDPHVMLSMLEYYLFLLVRFPLAAPLSKASSVPTHLKAHHMQRKEPYGEHIYFEVYRATLRHFLPYNDEDGRHINFQAGQQGARLSELFLRIIIAFWIEPQALVDPTAKAHRSILDQRARNGGESETMLDLDSSFELIQAKYDPPVSKVQKMLRPLLIHAILDPAVPLIATTKPNDRDGEWCLGSTMTALQPCIYNLIRATFRYASVHSRESGFFSTFDLWLMLLEPWNVKTGK